MKNIYFLLLFNLVSFSCISQITYKEGYIINNSGERTEVFIRFDETKGHLSHIEYKTSRGGKNLTTDLKSTKEYGVGEDYKFLRSSVSIDRASQDLEKLSGDRNPDFEEETLYLRLLIEGEYSLLVYQEKNLERFFIRKPSGEIEQLIFKKYTTGDNVIRKNSQYKQQLHNLLKCEGITVNKLMKVDYKKRDLISLFSDYHSCKGADFKVYYSRPKGELNFKVKGGLNFVNLKMEQNLYNMEDDFGYSVQPRIGFEIEYLVPMFNKKLSLFTEPSFSLYSQKKKLIVINNSQSENTTVTGVYQANVNLKYLEFELPLGMRYYIFLNKENTSRLYFNGGVSTNLVINNSEVPEDRNGETSSFELKHSRELYYFGGIGYSHKNKFNIEARFFPEKKLSSNFAYALNHHNSFSIIAGYTLF